MRAGAELIRFLQMRLQPLVGNQQQCKHHTNARHGEHQQKRHEAKQPKQPVVTMECPEKQCSIVFGVGIKTQGLKQILQSGSNVTARFSSTSASSKRFMFSRAALAAFKQYTLSGSTASPACARSSASAG